MQFVPLGVFFILLVVNVPVGIALLAAACFYFAFVNNLMPTDMVIQSLMSTTESFPYLAIPLFTCSAIIFNYSGITRRLLGLANLLVGHLTGGMAQVNVMASVLLSGVSGSANADAAMSSKVIVPEMTKLGYPKPFSAVLTAASACITPTIPPGIMVILYALASDVSIAALFMAGYVPGLLLYLAISITVAVVAKQRGYLPSRPERAEGAEILRASVSALWALALPLGIIMGLRYGLFTPTEAGAICVMYSLLVGFFVYRELHVKDLIPIVLESTIASAGIMFLICAAVAFGSYLTWENFPGMLANLLTENISTPLGMLLLINILLIAIGTVFEGGAAMILLAPLFVPIIMQLGIDPIHFGIIMALNLTISGFTPPVGTMMFTTIIITGITVREYIREAWVFLIPLLAVLLAVTVFPGLVMFLPDWLG